MVFFVDFSPIWWFFRGFFVDLVVFSWIFRGSSGFFVDFCGIPVFSQIFPRSGGFFVDFSSKLMKSQKRNPTIERATE